MVRTRRTDDPAGRRLPPAALPRFAFACGALACGALGFGCGARDGGPGAAAAVIVERRVMLLDGAGLAGRFEPSGVEVKEVSHELDRVERMCMKIPAGESARFDEVPVHEGARLEFLVGLDRANRRAVEVSIVAPGAAPRRERIDAAAERASWQAASIDLAAAAGARVSLEFGAADDVDAELLIGNPRILSGGRRLALEDVPPARVEETLQDLVEGFERGQVVTEDAEQPLAKVPWSFDSERRTAADEAESVIRAEPDSTFAVEVEVPDGAFLDLATFVFRPTGDDPGDVEFTLAVDGRERFTVRSDYLNIGQAQVMAFDRMTRRARVDLAGEAGRRVRLAFSTRRVKPAGDAVAHHAWKEIRLRRQEFAPRRRSSPDDPNVLVICVDTLRADHLSCYGYARPTSPNLDRLAARAQLFDNAFSTASWTLPATASLLTGLHPNTHGVLGNARSYLVDAITTLPEVLLARGVATAAFSANYLVNAALNFDQGFERFDHVFEDAGAVNDSLFEWIAECGQLQFFGYVHYMEPHSPYSAPGEHRQFFDPEYVEARDFSGPLPERWRTGKIEQEFSSAERAHLVDLYDAEIRYFDLELGRLLAHLERLGIADRTLVVVTADHGEEFFDHGGLGHGVTLYNEVLRVPLVLFDPRSPEAVRHAQPVSTGALFNTLLRRLGIAEPGTAQIAALGAHAPGPPGAAECDGVYSSTESHMEAVEARYASIVRGNAKLIADLLDEDRSELYDLAGDPHERRNLLTEQLALAEELRRCVVQFYERTAQAFPASWQPVLDEVRDLMEQLGYIQGRKPGR